MNKLAALSTLSAALMISTVALADDITDAKAQPLPSTAPTTEEPAASTTTVTSGDSTATATPMSTEPTTRPEATTLSNSVRPNKPLLLTGAIMLAGAYVTTAALTGASKNDNADKNLYLPVVGPWVHLGSRNATESNSTTDTLLVAGSGLIQGAGVGLIVASFFVPERVPTATIQAGNTKIHFAPASFGLGSAGVGAGGTF
jgi:hypothetical protein